MDGWRASSCRVRSFHTRENRGFDTVKSTQKCVHTCSMRNVSSGLPCCQPYVLVCCDGEFGCDWDGDVSLHFSARVVALTDAFARNAVSRFTCCRRSSRRLGDDTRCNLLRLFMHTYIFYSTLGFVMSDYGVHVRLLRTELEQRVRVLRHGEGSRESARRAVGVCRSWGAPLCATTPSAGTVCRPLSQHSASCYLLAITMLCLCCVPARVGLV